VKKKKKKKKKQDWTKGAEAKKKKDMSKGNQAKIWLFWLSYLFELVQNGGDLLLQRVRFSQLSLRHLVLRGEKTKTKNKKNEEKAKATREEKSGDETLASNKRPRISPELKANTVLSCQTQKRGKQQNRNQKEKATQIQREAEKKKGTCRIVFAVDIGAGLQQRLDELQIFGVDSVHQGRGVLPQKRGKRKNEAKR
jgi:hypothetical protein